MASLRHKFLGEQAKAMEQQWTKYSTLQALNVGAKPNYGYSVTAESGAMPSITDAAVGTQVSLDFTPLARSLRWLAVTEVNFSTMTLSVYSNRVDNWYLVSYTVVIPTQNCSVFTSQVTQ